MQGDAGKLKEESSPWIVESLSCSGCAESNAGKTSGKKIEVRDFIGVDCSCVIAEIFSFRLVYGAVGCNSRGIVVAVAHKRKTAELFGGGAERAHSAEHIEYSDCHRRYAVALQRPLFTVASFQNPVNRSFPALLHFFLRQLMEGVLSGDKMTSFKVTAPHSKRMSSTGQTGSVQPLFFL